MAPPAPWQLPAPQRPLASAPQLVQSASGAALQAPDWQVSLVQSVLSASQLVPLATGAGVQLPVLQVPTWQSLVSLSQMVPLVALTTLQRPVRQVPTRQSVASPSQTVPSAAREGAQAPLRQVPITQSAASASQTVPSGCGSQVTQESPSQTGVPQPSLAPQAPVPVPTERSSIQTVSEPATDEPSLVYLKTMVLLPAGSVRVTSVQGSVPLQVAASTDPLIVRDSRS